MAPRSFENRNVFLIRGPLGIWPFPLLNTIIQVLFLLSTLASQAYQPSRPRARTYNIVRDERGRIVAIEEVWVE
jgi:hypothetical protein